MRFAPIVPIKAMNITASFDTQMFLAHLCLESKEYVEKCKSARGYKILDNSYYERGKSMWGETLLRIADDIRASAAVLEDDSLKCFEDFYREGIDCFVVPHTKENLVKFAEHCCYEYGEGAILCLSHIATQKMFGGKKFSQNNRIAALKYLKENVDEQCWEYLVNGGLHFLGLGDYPFRELQLIQDEIGDNFSVDSSLFLYPFLATGGKVSLEFISLKSKLQSIDFYADISHESYAKLAAEAQRLQKLLNPKE